MKTTKTFQGLNCKQIISSAEYSADSDLGQFLDKKGKAFLCRIESDYIAILDSLGFEVLGRVSLATKLGQI
ncbi:MULTISPECIES: hypothetical protein [Methylobacter]